MKKAGLRIGVVCEGITDYFAIKNFVGASMASEGLDVLFVDLQPELDRTQPNGGWGLVEQWLRVNAMPHRYRRYIGGGLFESKLDSKLCDVFLIQMDSDILGDPAFVTFMRNHYDYNVINSPQPRRRGDEIRRILKLWSGIDGATHVEQIRHIFVAAVEATEAWCIAAFRKPRANPEGVSGNRLIQEFMGILHKSEGRPTQQFRGIDKNANRRKEYCEKHKNGAKWIRQYCESYAKGVEELSAVLGDL